MQKSFLVSGVVEIFTQDGGWHYIKIPKKYTDITKPIADADRGLVPIIATLGKFSWNTSLLPMGDGTHFIALPAKARKQNKILLGQQISLSFILRKRNM